jgi:RNase P protein component
MKRRMRAIMSELAPDRPQGAYLVRAGSDSPQLSFDELKVAMSRAVDKATKPKVERTTPRGDTRPTRAHQDAVE